MSTSQTTHRRSGKIALTVAGAALCLLALAALATGAVLTWAHATQRDSAGFYSTKAKTLATPTHALVSDDLNVGTNGLDWVFREGRLGTIRVTATGTGAKPVFIGIARASQVDGYLRGVSVDEITDFEVDPFTVASARRSGAATPARPAQESFWATSTTGSGKQTLTWQAQEGTWDVVVMNADGTAGVGTDVTLGAKVPVVFWLGVGLLVAGGLLAVGSAALIYAGSRGPRGMPSPATAARLGEGPVAS